MAYSYYVYFTILMDFDLIQYLYFVNIGGNFGKKIYIMGPNKKIVM